MQLRPGPYTPLCLCNRDGCSRSRGGLTIQRTQTKTKVALAGLSFQFNLITRAQDLTLHPEDCLVGPW